MLTCVLVGTRCLGNWLGSRQKAKRVERGDAEDLKPHTEESEDVTWTQNCQNWHANVAWSAEAALLFFVVQFLLFLVLGCLVNRLRVAFGPPMTLGLASM